MLKKIIFSVLLITSFDQNTIYSMEINLKSNIKLNEISFFEKIIIPTPSKATKVHAISGISFENNIIFAYYANYPSEKSNIHMQNICISRGTINDSNTITWISPSIAATPFEISNKFYNSENKCFDPVLFLFKNIIYLFYKVGTHPRNWFGFVKISYDYGESWTKPIPLPEGILGPTKCKPLIAQNDNDLICGSSTQKENFKVENNKQGDGWISINILKDFGKLEILEINNSKNWELIDNVTYGNPGSVIIQPAIWQYNTNIYMLCRSNNGKLVYTNSNDYGKTWSNSIDSELPSNYSAIDILSTETEIFMAWNPINNNFRNKLILSKLINPLAPEKLSSWEEIFVIESDDQNPKTEYSFPSIIFQNNKLIVAYGVNQKEMRLAIIDFKT
ncbi:exo-alpha-sialidase [Candidatus Dependentiae bacterium]|nr:exo-alpha-sialidase [Candidatus Dependentiae bacterium]MBU4386999.1 exo-alpha-sialidase [Candidatus Dependentiae bacterium]MCG2756673.1 exo-alpha-sialidase [Candidatus Dependentiae bacterium]